MEIAMVCTASFYHLWMWQIIINVTTFLYELIVNIILFFVVRYIEIECQWDKSLMQCIQKFCLK